MKTQNWKRLVLVIIAAAGVAACGSETDETAQAITESSVEGSPITPGTYTTTAQLGELLDAASGEFTARVECVDTGAGVALILLDSNQGGE